MIEVAVEHKCFLGEGPVWDDRRRAICWIDITAGEIHEWNPSARVFKTLNVNQMIGAIAFCENGYTLAALKNGIVMIDPYSGGIEHIIHPEAGIPGNRYNDGKCDALGRFWIGTMSVNEHPDLGSVYVLEQKSRVKRKIENTTISNGMAWSADNRYFYFIDTPTLQVVRYDYDLLTGNISGKKIAIQMNEQEGYPDGMTIDEEGMLWIAHWGGWQVSRWNPLTGEKLFSLPVPAAHVSSCTFGGDELADLYITTAKKGLSQKELEGQPLAGSLFVWGNCGFKGVKAFEFKNQALYETDTIRKSR